MHIILALLSGLGAVFWAIYRLDREGFDFASLNPFLWKRRAHWKAQHDADPLFNLADPLEIAGVLLLAIAKESGEISSDEKRRIKELMVSELKRQPGEANELFLASSYLLQNRGSLLGKVASIVAPCREAFTEEQVTSILALLRDTAETGEPPTEQQETFIQEFSAEFERSKSSGTW